MKTLREFVNSGNLLIAAHRGASGTVPENTMPAFSMALEEGANMIETDLHMTSDGYFVAYHDMNHFKKNKNFDPKNPDTLENLMKLDAGTWFDIKFSGLKIPLLNEILEFASGRLYLNLEIKSELRKLNTEHLEKLISIIFDYGFEKYLMFSSFDNNYLRKIKEIETSIPTAIINKPWRKDLPSNLTADAFSDAYICSINTLNNAILNDASENDIFLAVYGVDKEKHLKKAMQFGIQALGTNYPGKIINLIEQNY
jgi:glycerophosphoryl diester phosphodiesterase